MMHLVNLSLSERRALAKQLHETKDVKIFQRAQALLWLFDGMSVSEIAKRLGVTRRTIYNWVSSYQNRCNNSFRSRLQDRPRPGRPSKKSAIILPQLDLLLHASPREYGYHHAEWTASLLKQVLYRDQALDVSPKTIHRCLKQSHYVWKRPGYALSRQSATWAQSKGGSKEV
jgi:transposase